MSATRKKGPIGIIGAGSWGTTLARVLAGNGHPVHLWCFEEEVFRQIKQERENRLFLPGVLLPPTVEPLTDLSEAIREKEMLLLVIPSHVFRDVLNRMLPDLSRVQPGCLWITATKGIENDSLLTMTGILREMLDPAQHPYIGALSGPSFAKEVSRELPTAVALAATTPDAAVQAQKILANSFFRVYTNPDLTGVELEGP